MLTTNRTVRCPACQAVYPDPSDPDLRNLLDPGGPTILTGRSLVMTRKEGERPRFYEAEVSAIAETSGDIICGACGCWFTPPVFVAILAERAMNQSRVNRVLLGTEAKVTHPLQETADRLAGVERATQFFVSSGPADQRRPTIEKGREL